MGAMMVGSENMNTRYMCYQKCGCSWQPLSLACSWLWKRQLSRRGSSQAQSARTRCTGYHQQSSSYSSHFAVWCPVQHI